MLVGKRHKRGELFGSPLLLDFTPDVKRPTVYISTTIEHLYFWDSVGLAEHEVAAAIEVCAARVE